jgi:hypothetical protein
MIILASTFVVSFLIFLIWLYWDHLNFQKTIPEWVKTEEGIKDHIQEIINDVAKEQESKTIHHLYFGDDK